MSSLALQLEIALHDVDCKGHGPDFEGHGDKYTRLAEAAIKILPSDRFPWWLQDIKDHVELIANNVIAINNRVGA